MLFVEGRLREVSLTGSSIADGVRTFKICFRELLDMRLDDLTGTQMRSRVCYVVSDTTAVLLVI